VEAIKSLTFPPETRIKDVDADRPLDEVLLAVKHCIWQEL
jgi:hypothetical protein